MDTPIQEPDELFSPTHMAMERKYLKEQGFNQEEVDLMLKQTYFPQDLTPEELTEVEILNQRSRELAGE